MPKDTSQRKQTALYGPRPGVSALAAKALSLLQFPPSADDIVPISDIAAELRDMVLRSPAMDAESMVKALREQGLSDASIVDHYIPCVAHTLGDCWLTDELPFAQVSIGSSRLQGMLPYLDDEGPEGLMAPKGVALLLVLGQEQHTLGAFVLAHQLRRMGISIRIEVGSDTATIAQMINQIDFDVVLISCAQVSGVESVGKLVTDLRKEPIDLPPLVLGGAIVGGLEELVQMTGVDHVLTGRDEILPLMGELADKQSTSR